MKFNLDFEIKHLVWDGDRYRFPSGKAVSERQLFGYIRKESDRVSVKLRENVNKLLTNEITFEDWQRNTATIIKDGHVKMARFGRGGTINTFAIHYLDVGNELRKNQYPRLRNFAEDILSGKLSRKQIEARLDLYAKSIKVSYERARLSVKSDRGHIYGRRRLGSCVNHCQDCIDYAMRGWMELRLVTPPGVNCACGANCCCSVETSRNIVSSVTAISSTETRSE